MINKLKNKTKHNTHLMTKATRVKKNTKKKKIRLNVCLRIISLFYLKVLYVINTPSIINLRVSRFIFTSIKCRIDLYKF